MLESLCLAFSSQMVITIMESDTLALIQTIFNLSSCHAKIKFIIKAIVLMLDKLYNPSCFYIPRSYNFLAHGLASKAIEVNLFGKMLPSEF